jgi:hypothetical protein
MGSITAHEVCHGENGTFHPVVFKWKMHVYSFEKDQTSI